MKGSMLFFAQPAFFTAGGAESFGVVKAQNFRPSSIFGPLATAAGPTRGSGAPILIHASKSATISLDRRFLGGISRLSSLYWMAFSARLLAGSLGTIAGPVSP